MTSNPSNGLDQAAHTTAAANPGPDAQPKFVRGGGQLAVYRPQWNQTGHILTWWEAREAYGQETIDEALEYGSAILRETPTSIEDAFRKRREDLGLGHSTVANAVGLQTNQIASAESQPSRLSIGELEQIAFVLGLDERFVAFRSDCGGDADLGVRLKVLHREPGNAARVSQRNAILLSEAASVIRVQHRLQEWLRLSSELGQFVESSDYGSVQNPAWHIGYALAKDARRKLGLGIDPIPSMRELVETRLGIPVVQAEMNPRIAGATVTNTNDFDQEVRGIVLNVAGENDNIWVRRATLAHELGHLLYDPNYQLDTVRVDFYQNNEQNAETYTTVDYVEQRANAFAIAFLAPIESVLELTPTPVADKDVANVMSTFGISRTAAKFHISNCHYRQFSIPEPAPDTGPYDEQIAAENFTVDYFPLLGTPHQRRGKFSGLVAAAYELGFISEHTAASYLHSGTEEFTSVSSNLRDLFGVQQIVSIGP